MGTVRVQKVQLKATNHDDVILLSTGSNLIVQQGASNTPTFKVAHGSVSSLRNGTEGLFGETDAAGGYLGLVSSNGNRRSARFGFAGDEAAETGFGTLCARSLQVTDPGLSNVYKTRVDPSDGALVKQTYLNGSWLELSRESLSSVRFVGTLTATNIMTSNFIVNTSSIALKNIPSLPASQISGGTFLVGAFACPVSTTSSLQVAGSATLSSDLSVAGTFLAGGGATFKSGLTSSNGLYVAAGGATFGSNVSAAGAFLAGGGATLSNGLVVASGSSLFAGSVAASNMLSVAGSTVFNSNASVAGPFLASGPSAFLGAVAVSNTLTVTGATTCTSNISVTGLSTLIGAVTCSNTLNVSGGTTLGSNLSVVGPVVSTNMISGTSFACGGNITAAGGVLPASSNTYDIGSSALPWRNATLAGTVTATAYVGLTRKYWNTYNLGLTNETAGYHKIASLGANNSVLRVSGQFGGEAAFALLDLHISTRPSPPVTITGTAYGNLTAAKAYGDVAVFYNSNASSYDVYLSSTKQFGSWDLSVEGSFGNVLLEPSSANTASPPGTLQTPSTLSSLFSSTETSSNLSSFATSISCSNLATAGSVTIAGTDPFFSNKDWASWMPAIDSNATLTVSYARACSTNKRATVEYSLQMAFAASAQTASITLPATHLVKYTTSAAQTFIKSTGSNTFKNYLSISGSVPTVGTAIGGVVADSSTSRLIFQLTNFIPGTWSCTGNLSYELV